MPSPTWHSQISLFDSEEGRAEAEHRERTRYGATPTQPEQMEAVFAQPRVTRFAPPNKANIVNALSARNFCPTCGQELPGTQIVPSEAEQKSEALSPDVEYQPSQTAPQSLPLRATHSLRKQESPIYEPRGVMSVQQATPQAETFAQQCTWKFRHELFTDLDKLSFFENYYDESALTTTQLYGILKTISAEQVRLNIFQLCKNEIPDLYERWDVLCSLFRSKRSQEVFKREVKAIVG